MVLFATSYYTFYKFVMEAEQLNDFQKQVVNRTFISNKKQK